MASFECKVTPQMRPAIYKGWEPTEDGGVVTVPMRCLVWPMPTRDGTFLVELDDGICARVQPYELRFLDGKELFGQYGWEADT